MLATVRLLAIEENFGEAVERIVPKELDEATLRVTLYLKDGSNLRVVEQWEGEELKRYSYYWLTSGNELRIGWDNAPHHQQLDGFPHHKHVGRQDNLQPSKEIGLEAVMVVVLREQNIQ
jgi:hypothetical protein